MAYVSGACSRLAPAPMTADGRPPRAGTPPASPARSSRQRYHGFVEDYRRQRLDDDEPPSAPKRADDARPAEPAPDEAGRKAQRRARMREYLRWLRPHRGAVAVVAALALLRAGLEMIEPLFMRYIIDHVLLDRTLDAAGRVARLNVAGATFLAVVVVSALINVTKDYRQRILNVRVTLALRRFLFDRLLHLPLPRLWEFKTGGIISRLTGDIDTTTGLLQLAVVSPAISVVRLVIAMGILFSINWRLALTALALIPGVMLLSLTFARRVRPI